MKNKGIVFTIDAILALLFISLLLLIGITSNKELDDFEKYQVNQIIGDLLITSQILGIENINEVEQNYTKLLGNREGYIKINNDQIRTGIKNKLKSELISQRITYINISNKEIYIEIGAYI